ncbi:hypothetical protein [Spiroplasma endosymbiont of Apeira syringaria]|uniref:hypothetical protein n=1 Tax=Spiroplasma endosymbiont of Apeira syringaria TaxID=3066307 RepID=UPI0030D5334A
MTNKYLDDYYGQVENENINQNEKEIKKMWAYILYYEEQNSFNFLFNQDFNNIDLSKMDMNMTMIFDEENKLIQNKLIKSEIERNINRMWHNMINNLKSENDEIQTKLIKSEFNFVEVNIEIKKIKEENSKLKEIERITSNSPKFIDILENLKNQGIEHRTPSPFFPSPLVNNEFSIEKILEEENRILKQENSKLKKENIYLKKEKSSKKKYQLKKLNETKNKINLKLKQLQSKKNANIIK